jgi:hypothetical protein
MNRKPANDEQTGHDVLAGFAFKVDRIISDAQSGAARGALDAAIELGLSHGGDAPFDRVADDGPIPKWYFVRSCPGGFAERCARNIRYSDGTLLLSFGGEEGIDGRTAHARDFAKKKHKASAHLQLYAGREPGPNMITSTRQWLTRHRIRTLHVTGPLERKEPGIAAAVKALLVAVLRVEGAGA